MAIMSKKVHQVDTVDFSTGEIVSSKSTFVSRNDEMFLMLRTTEGLDWFFELSSNEKNLLMLLHEWSSRNGMRVGLMSHHRDFISKHLGIKHRSIYYVLNGLIDKDCIQKVGRNDFMVNPRHLFKCSTGEIQDKIEYYESLKQ